MTTILDLQKKKNANEKITMITCYDYSMATIINETEVDCVLVGDSASMVMHGYANTTFATVDLMVLHTQAVARAITNKLIIGDLPFLSYRKSLSHSMTAITQLMQAGAHAIKLEGAPGNLRLIEHIVESGVAVLGHIGLTPQFSHQLGGFKVQGKETSQAEQLMLHAKNLASAGCCAIVLECIPCELAKSITESIQIPTIGIGAGPHTSGQVLVLQDMLGMTNHFKPKFLKTYLNGYQLIKDAVNHYVTEVKGAEYPSLNKHVY